MKSTLLWSKSSKLQEKIPLFVKERYLTAQIQFRTQKRASILCTSNSALHGLNAVNSLGVGSACKPEWTASFDGKNPQWGFSKETMGYISCLLCQTWVCHSLFCSPPLYLKKARKGWITHSKREVYFSLPKVYALLDWTTSSSGNTGNNQWMISKY